MKGVTALALAMSLSCTALSANAVQELPEPPEARADNRGRFLSPYLENGTLAPWVGTVMARKLDLDFRALAGGAGATGITNASDLALVLSSERPAGLEGEFAALTRGLDGGGELAGDLRTGARLARLIGDGDPDKIISRLGTEITKTVATEAFSRVAGEVGGMSALLGPIASLAASAIDSPRTTRPSVDTDALRDQADRSFDRLDDMLVHTVVYYRQREDFEYAIEAVLQAYPGAHSGINDAMREAGEIVHAEVRRMGGAETMDIEWVSEDE